MGEDIRAFINSVKKNLINAQKRGTDLKALRVNPDSIDTVIEATQALEAVHAFETKKRKAVATAGTVTTAKVKSIS